MGWACLANCTKQSLKEQTTIGHQQGCKGIEKYGQLIVFIAPKKIAPRRTVIIGYKKYCLTTMVLEQQFE
jgi:hypothetical protein